MTARLAGEARRRHIRIVGLIGAVLASVELASAFLAPVTPAFVAVALPFAAPAAGLAAQEAPPPVSPAPVAVDTFSLPNGLRVAVSEDHSAPVVAVSLRYRVGSGHEAPGQRGFAHVFEHLLLPGTDALEPGESERLVGAAGGEQGAVTDGDAVTFTYRVPAHRLDLALWLEAERMTGLRISEAGLDAVRRLVVRERWLRRSGPYGAAREALDTLPGGYAPYAHPSWVVQDLAGATVEEVAAFVTRHFVPANATLVVVGDVTPAAVRERVEVLFGTIPGGEPAPPLPPPDPPVPQPGPRRVETGGAGSPVPVVYVAWGAPPEGHPDAPALELLAALLDGEDGLLRRGLGERVAADAGALLRLRRGPGLFVVVASPGGGTTTETVEAAVVGLVSRLREEGVSREDLERARTLRDAARIRTRLRVLDTAEALQRAWHLRGDPARIDGEAGPEDVSAGDVARVLRTYLVPEGRIVVVTRPVGAGGRP